MKSIDKVIFITQHVATGKQHLFIFNFAGLNMSRVEFVFHCLSRLTECDCATYGINNFLNDIYDNYGKP